MKKINKKAIVERLKKRRSYYVVVLVALAVTVAITVAHVVARRPSAQADRVLSDYFVSTNDYYTEKYRDSLASLAANLHYYDLDGMVKDRYRDCGPITCTAVEAPSGTVVYDYGFYTKVWQVELCTMIENDPNSITTWIILYNPMDEKHAIESVPETVTYRIDNLVVNLSKDSCSTNLFECERKTFADLLSLISSGALDKEDGLVPFDKVGLRYNIISPPLEPR